jgi:hypothetical protein
MYSHGMLRREQLAHGWLRSQRRFFSRHALQASNGGFSRWTIISGAPPLLLLAIAMS